MRDHGEMSGGESGIRTLGTGSSRHTRFPVAPLKPLGQLSVRGIPRAAGAPQAARKRTGEYSGEACQRQRALLKRNHRVGREFVLLVLVEVVYAHALDLTFTEDLQ